jgi:hypothetical protein
MERGWYVVQINLPSTKNSYWIGSNGRFQKDTLGGTVIHELIHAIDGKKAARVAPRLAPTRCRMRSSASARWRGLQALVFALALAGCDDGNPAPRGQGRHAYWSTDMSLVKFWRKYADEFKVNPSRPPDFVIPRAYVKTALPYWWPTPKTVPTEARDVTNIVIFLAHDSGEALPVAQGPDDSRFTDGFDRRRYAFVNVYIRPPQLVGIHVDEAPPPRPGAWTPGTPVDDDGYVRTFSPNGLYQISGCLLQPPRADLFCRYSARFTPTMTVHAFFSDYRAMGGLPFAERVLSTIRTTICKYNDCSN